MLRTCQEQLLFLRVCGNNVRTGKSSLLSFEAWAFVFKSMRGSGLRKEGMAPVLQQG